MGLIKKTGDMVKRLRKLSRKCLQKVDVIEGWKAPYIILIHDGKRGRAESTNYKRLSLLRIPGRCIV